MPFDTALSGIRAASTELNVTGNNIANASTTGFKSSRVEFGDVYAQGSGSVAIGSGVQIQDVAQNFEQGNVAFTEKDLDLAINGNGFFVLNQQGETRYTRAGAFGLDDRGFVVNTTGAFLQGFPADAQGNIGGIAGDIQIQTSNLAPRRTTLVESVLNLDAAEPVLQREGRSLTTEGVGIGVTQVGRQNATTTVLTGAPFTLPLANDFLTTPMDFTVELTAPATNFGAVDVNLQTTTGVPRNVTTFNDLNILASVINSQIFTPTPPQTAIDVVARAQDLGGGNFAIVITAAEEGLSSDISISGNTANSALIGLTPALAAVSGEAQVTNGYPAQPIQVTNPDGDTVTYNTVAGDSAATTASGLNALQGVSATARTEATISNYTSAAGNLALTVNSVTLTGDSLAALETEINGLSNSTLPGISAVHNAAAGTLVLTSAGGGDIAISIDSLDDGDAITVLGDPDALPQTLEVDAAADGIAAGSSDASINSLVVGGGIDIVFDEGFDLVTPPNTLIFQPISPTEFTNVTLNEFDPTDQATYNSATSMTVFDSLGIAHVMTQYFVKQEYDPNNPTTTPNHWQVHIQIDGEDIGDPNTLLPPPQNTVATDAVYNIFFNDDGSLDTTRSEPILISNWVPLDEEGQPNSAAGPQNVLAGGSIPIPEPPTSSNFIIDYTGTTQTGSAFSVNDADQNGFATGRLSGLNIDASGIVFARFTNGESQILGQVALADFPNEEGLEPSSNSTWVENFRSGEPRVAAANTGALGTVQAGALEESNVDISAELVNLIIAQRNFQASAKTIETADTVTQTIINLR